MEVHHHAHPSSSSGHRKKWTHYFWEFLMLFLAVFCGFMAENIREHKVEHLRAKEFARSLVKDLGNDTVAITNYRKLANRYNSIADSLIILNGSNLDGANATKFSFYTRFTYWTEGVSWNRTTFEQIKNSGSLRYFKHTLLEKLMEYDAMVNAIEQEKYNHVIRGNTLINSINKVVEPAFHQKASNLYLFTLDTISNETMQYYLGLQTKSLENKRDDINAMLNMVVVQQRNLRFGESRWIKARELATELIGAFKKEYHID